MDINQLYFDHQLLLMKADREPSVSVRRGYEVAASHVAGRIGCLQTALGASGAGAWALAADGAVRPASFGHCVEGRMP